MASGALDARRPYLSPFALSLSKGVAMRHALRQALHERWMGHSPDSSSPAHRKEA